MVTRVWIGLDTHQNGLDCGRGAARAALARCDSAGEIALALLFTSHPQPAQVLKGVNEMLRGAGHATPLIGATSAGEYTHEGYVEGGAGVMLIQSEQFRFHPLAYQRRWFGSSRLLGNLRGTSEAGLGSAYHHRALMLFPDDQSMNLDGIVDRAMTETALLYDILGGPGPTIPAPPRPPAVFFNRQLIRAGLAGAEVLGQQPFGLALANGWTPIGGPYRVTRVDRRRVLKIDGRPAREVYEDFLAGQGHDPAHLPHELLLQYPVGICKDGTCKVSVVMGFDQAGALQTTSPPPENALIHILATQPDAMVTAVHRAIGQALQKLPAQRPPAGLLFIDCMSTAMVLGEAYQQQRRAVTQAIGEVPFLGFRSHGVLARLQGQTVGHYECSVATCLFPG